jgi:predicted HTH transcriptional regulator
MKYNEAALEQSFIDYSNEAPPKFEIFDDRIEITSTGGLPVGINKKEFFEGVSIPRNKELMRIFKDLDMVEQLGSGIPRILRIYPKGCFNISENYIRMSFPKDINEGSSNITGGVIGGVIEELTERQVEVLKAIHENNRITYKELSKSFGIAESAVSKHIDALKEKGVLQREGGTRGFWKLVNPENE